MILHSIPYQKGILWVDKRLLYPELNAQYYQQWYPITGPLQTEIITYLGHPLDSLTFYKIVAQTNLSLPNIPYIAIDEDEEQEKKRVITKWVGKLHKAGFDAEEIDKITEEGFYYYYEGYKAASAKKYTEEDLRKAWNHTGLIDNGKGMIGKMTFEDFIQTLQPKPVSVEIEMRKGCGIIIKPCDCSEMDTDCQYLIDKPITYIKDGKTFLKVKKVNCES